jgi:hypothetical protein
MTETKDHDKLFADLEALNEQQIEVGLAAGVWNEQVRPLVQHYLYDLKLKRVEAAAGELDEMRKGARLALEEAGKAKFWAAAAFIIAGGRCWLRWRRFSSRSLLCGDTASSHLGEALLGPFLFRGKVLRQHVDLGRQSALVEQEALHELIVLGDLLPLLFQV